MRLFGISGWSGSGKTTLLDRLIPALKQSGLTVSTVKHAHHSVDLDKPGKDSWRHREAGASEVLLATRDRWVLMRENRGAPEPELDELLGRLGAVDLVLVEGFKAAPMPKLEVWQPALGREPLWATDATVRAVAVVGPLEAASDCRLPLFDADAVDAIAGFIRAEAPEASVIYPSLGR